MSQDRWDIQSLLDEASATNPNPRTENRYPVIVETSERHLVWIEGKDHDDALERLSNDSDWYEEINSQTRIEGGYSVSMEKPDEHNWDWEVYTSDRIYGPKRGCSKCGTEEYAIGYGVWHKDSCPAKAVA